MNSEVLLLSELRCSDRMNFYKYWYELYKPLMQQREE